MGCDVLRLNCNPSGFFPHGVEPTQANLTELMKTVPESGADLGIAHDGDADRMMVVDDHGEFVASDKLLVIMAEEMRASRVVTRSDIKIKRNGNYTSVAEQKITWSVEEAHKAGYEHFMLKEIHEQPRVVRDTLVGYCKESEPIAELEWMRDAGIEDMLILACGTSYNAALVGKYIFEELFRIPVRAELASEFNYYPHTLAKTMAIVITQSGETADVLKAVR